jgi:hypothetical protein
MTVPLVSPNLIKRMRKIANRGLQTEVTVLSMLPVAENPYGDDTVDWVTLGEYMGWVRGVNTARLQDVGDVVGSVGVFRLHLKAEVEVEAGDMVVIDDSEYIVQDSNLENTYRVFTTATLRRRQ